MFAMNYTMAVKSSRLIMTFSIIELHEVNKTYSTAAGDFVALKDVKPKVNPGEFLGIIGKSDNGFL